MAHETKRRRKRVARKVTRYRLLEFGGGLTGCCWPGGGGEGVGKKDGSIEVEAMQTV